MTGIQQTRKDGLLWIEVPPDFAFSLHIRGSGTGETEYSFPLHGHSEVYELTYVKRGTLTHEIAGHTFHQQRGTVTIIRPGETHQLRGRKMSFVNFGWHVSIMRMLHDHRLGGNLLAELLARPQPLSTRLSHPLWESYEEKFSRLLLLQGTSAGNTLCLSLLAEILCDAFLLPCAGKERCGWPSWLHRVIDELETDPDLNITIAELVSASGRTQEHLTRTFQRFLHTTPAQFLNNRRIAQAERLLQFSDLKIEEIARRVGFNNPTWFYHCFKAKHGMSPGTFRRQKRHRLQLI